MRLNIRCAPAVISSRLMRESRLESDWAIMARRRDPPMEATMGLARMASSLPVMLLSWLASSRVNKSYKDIFI
jgi:hypothetical protein